MAAGVRDENSVSGSARLLGQATGAPEPCDYVKE
jgi:hypothetical protein